MSIVLLLQAVVAVLLCLSILVQQKAASAGLTGAGTSSTYVQRRGAEKVLYQATIVLSLVFVVMTVVQWYL